jgi:hypothetical protein
MRTLHRLSSVIETTATIGPASLAGFLVMTSLSLFALVARLVSQGYYRFFFSSK